MSRLRRLKVNNRKKIINTTMCSLTLALFLGLGQRMSTYALFTDKEIILCDLVINMAKNEAVEEPSEPEELEPPKEEVEIPSEPEELEPPKEEVEIPKEPEIVEPPKEEIEIPSEPEEVEPPKQEMEIPKEPETIEAPKQEVEVSKEQELLDLNINIQE